MSKAKQASRDEQQQFWQMVFEAHRQSGLSIVAFCRQEGLTEPAFYYWRKKLGALKQQPKPQQASGEPAFIEVASPAVAGSASLELVLCCPPVLQIKPGVDGDTLTKVLSALGQAGLC